MELTTTSIKQVFIHLIGMWIDKVDVMLSMHESADMTRLGQV